MVSIIVPVYNAQNSLERCLMSIIRQRYPQWELILVDDGSQDDSLAICKRYSDKDSRIRVFHTENCGVSSARNTGMENAHGEYISFVDSDDMIHTDFLSECLSNKEDLIVTNYKKPWNKSDHFSPWHSSSELGYAHLAYRNGSKIDSLHYKEDHPELIFQQRGVRTVWGKVFVRKIIEEHHIRFDTNIRYGEDTIFVLQYCLHIKTIAYVFQHLYEYEKPPYYAFFKYKTTLDEYLNILSILQDLTLRLRAKSYNVDVLYAKNVNAICGSYIVSLYCAGCYSYKERKYYVQKLRNAIKTGNHWGLIKKIRLLSVLMETHAPFFMKDFLLRMNFAIKSIKRRMLNKKYK